jgi:hypothetical protein
MSVTRWKEIMRPDTYHLPDGRVFTYTPALLAGIAATSKAMVRAGLRAPICFEHHPLADPVEMGQNASHPNAWLARGYAGKVIDYRVSPSGSLEALQEFDRESDAELAKRIGTVSPRMNFDFRDERGRRWPGISVGHVAITAKPVDRRQRPAEYGLNVSSTVPMSTKTDCHEFSFGANMEPLAGADMGGGSAATMMGDPNAAALIAALAKNGITATGSTVDEIIQALEAMAGGMPEGTETAATPPMMMSWAAPLLQSKAALDRAQLLARINLLAQTGRVSEQGKQALIAGLSTMDFSFAGYDMKNGELKPCKHTLAIEVLERYGAPKAFARRSSDPADFSFSAAGTEPVPAPILGQSDADQAKRDADAIETMSKAWKG